MLEKPPIKDQDLIEALGQDYGLDATSVTFQPIGNASNTWIYAVESAKENYFLKIKKGGLDEGSLMASRFLQDSGIKAVLGPLSTSNGSLCGACGEYTLILFPFVVAKSADKQGLTEKQWKEFGHTLRTIHQTKVPHELRPILKQEDYFSEAWPCIENLKTRIEQRNFSDLVQQDFASFWQKRVDEIDGILNRAKELGKKLRNERPADALCHTDIHLANVLVDTQGQLYLVDWDAVILAAKERDLMFVIGRPNDSLFFEGYGNAPINETALAYYRHDWVLQELADYGDRVFFSTDAGEETRREAVKEVQEMFQPGNVVDDVKIL